jgi:hypothetical protein
MNIETSDIIITYKQDPIDNHNLLSYNIMAGSEHEKD